MSEKVNGLNVKDLGALVDTIKNNPHLSKSIWYARSQWKGGFACDVKSRNFSWTIDEPFDLGGSDTAPNPAEMYLGALCGCLNVGYALNAAMIGVSIQKLDIDVEGDIDLPGFVGLAGSPGFEDQAKLPGYTNVRVKVRMKSNASPQQLQQIHQNVLATSPIGLSVANKVGLDIQIESRRMA
ncbi:MAG: OsmC family protein [Nitrospinota bacterium]|nr:OsmC family protein [Nitrospinota bacterium]